MAPIWVLLLVLAAALVASVAIGVRLADYDRELCRSSPRGSAGIVALELAFTHERAAALLADWRQDSGGACARMSANGAVPRAACALASVKLDFGFIFAYSIFGAVLFVVLLRALRVPIDGFWALAAALPVFAGAADVLENAFLWKMLTVGPEQPAVLTAGLFPK